MKFLICLVFLFTGFFSYSAQKSCQKTFLSKLFSKNKVWPQQLRDIISKEGILSDYQYRKVRIDLSKKYKIDLPSLDSKEYKNFKKFFNRKRYRLENYSRVKEIVKKHKISSISGYVSAIPYLRIMYSVDFFRKVREYPEFQSSLEFLGKVPERRVIPEHQLKSIIQEEGFQRLSAYQKNRMRLMEEKYTDVFLPPLEYETFAGYRAVFKEEVSVSNKSDLRREMMESEEGFEKFSAMRKEKLGKSFLYNNSNSSLHLPEDPFLNRSDETILPYEKAKEVLSQFTFIKQRISFQELLRDAREDPDGLGALLKGIPSNPKKAYPKEWKGYDDFLPAPLPKEKKMETADDVKNYLTEELKRDEKIRRIKLKNANDPRRKFGDKFYY